MKNFPLYQNLDTSFVNLSALVRYLRERRFLGSVRVELDGYEAEIRLETGGAVNAREHDRVAGRIAEGGDAFQRTLIRAREPGGVIHVFQTIAEGEINEPEKGFSNSPPAAGRGANDGETPAAKKEISEQSTATTARAINDREEKREITFHKPLSAPAPPQFENIALENNAPPPPPSPSPSSAPLPLEFSNRVEEKARRAQIVTEEEWHTLLQLAGELLGEVDRTLAEANLDFVSAFAKARNEIAADYPFLNPAAGAFEYSNGRVTMPDPVGSKVFAAGLNEALRRILEKLGANPRFAETYRRAVQSVLALIHRRKQLYDKFFITPQLEKILGV